MNAPDQSVVVIFMILLWLAFVILCFFACSLTAYCYRKKQENERLDLLGLPRDTFERASPPSFYDRPNRWLAIKSQDILRVQQALGLCNPTPCTFAEGLGKMSGDRRLFLSPPMDGWIFVIGPGLPDPAEDIDRLYHFIMRLTNSLGAVQYFSANSALNHHAWVRAENNRIYRAYAWAGETLWNQGDLTAAERDLGLRCFAYAEPPSIFPFSAREAHFANAEKVPLLATRWSLDPNTLHQLNCHPHPGISGDFSSRS